MKPKMPLGRAQRTQCSRPVLLISRLCSNVIAQLKCHEPILKTLKYKIVCFIGRYLFSFWRKCHYASTSGWSSSNSLQFSFTARRIQTLLGCCGKSCPGSVTQRNRKHDCTRSAVLSVSWKNNVFISEEESRVFNIVTNKNRTQWRRQSCTFLVFYICWLPFTPSRFRKCIIMRGRVLNVHLRQLELAPAFEQSMTLMLIKKI